MRLTTILLLIAASILAVVHYFALEFYIYWQYSYFDTLMHALGGSIVGLALFAFSDMGLPVPKILLRFWGVLAFALFIGVVLELFELTTGLYMAKNYVFDTTLDLCMDVVGGALGYLVGSRLTTLDHD